MVPTLKKFLSSRGDILADDRSNTLIIRDMPAVLPVLDNLLRQLDRKSQQVEIEARVVAANRSFSREIGTSSGHCSSPPATASWVALPPSEPARYSHSCAAVRIGSNCVNTTPGSTTPTSGVDAAAYQPGSCVAHQRLQLHLPERQIRAGLKSSRQRKIAASAS